MTDQQHEELREIGRKLQLLFAGDYGKIEFNITPNGVTYAKTETIQYNVEKPNA